MKICKTDLRSVPVTVYIEVKNFLYFGLSLVVMSLSFLNYTSFLVQEKTVLESSLIGILTIFLGRTKYLFKSPLFTWIATLAWKNWKWWICQCCGSIYELIEIELRTVHWERRSTNTADNKLQRLEFQTNKNTRTHFIIFDYREWKASHPDSRVKDDIEIRE